MRPHPQVKHHAVEIGEIKAALQVEWTLIVGIHHEVLKEKFAVDDAHGVVIEAHGNTVWHTDQICRVQIHLTFHMRFVQRTLHRQFTFSIAFQTDNLVWNKTIDEVERQLVKTDLGIEIACAFRAISTLHGSHILALVGQDAIHIVGAIALWHIDEFGTDIAHRTFLIDQVVDVQIRRDRKFLLGLNHVEVTIHDARDVWHIWDDAQYLVEIEVTQADGDVLQGILIIIVGINTHAHAARSRQKQVGRNTLVIAQHQVVVLVGGKLLVAQDRMRIYQGDLDAVVLHQSRQTDINTQLVLGIEELGMDIGASLLQLAIDQGTESILRIVLVVLHPSHILDGIALGMNQGSNRIQLYALCHQGIDIHIAIQASYRRSVQVHLHGLKLITTVLQEARDEIALARSKIDVPHREILAKADLVYLAILHLTHQFLLQTIYMS